ARACADDRPRHGRDAARRRGLSGRACRRRGRRAADPARPRRRVTAAPARLLLRDLAQLATPAGTGAPLRGSALGDVEVLEDAYVLCAGDAIEAVGWMRDLPALDGDVRE